MAKLLSNTRVYGTATVDTQLFVNGTNSAHSAATGALQISGGLGVAGGGFFGGSVTATNFVGAFSGTASSANDITGGTAGQLLYQISPGDTGFVGPGTAGQLLVSAGAAAPVYTNTSSIYVNSSVFAEDIRGGTAGQLVYQSAANTTAFAGPGTAGQVLTSNGANAPVYVTTTTLYVGNAVTSTNIRGGAANQFLYQSASGTTAFANTGSMYVGRAVVADSVTGGGSTVQTVQQTANAAYYLTFVDSNNSVATAESIFTTSSFVVNPGTGNVGIGTTSPGAKLELVDEGRIRLRDTLTGASTYSDINYSAGAMNISVDAGSTRASSLLRIYMDGSEAMRIDSSRNVGIGPIPNYKLDVDGVIQGRQGLRTGLGYNSYISDRLQFAASTGFSHHQFKQVDPGGGSTRLDLRRYTGSGDGFDGGEMMTFLNNGNVGIGLTNPARKLQVAGDITVNSVYKDFQSYTGASSNYLTRTWTGVLIAGSDGGGAETYTVIETAVPQDSYMMGGFTIDWFENYYSTNAKTSIQLGGYWNAESNGGFIGWEYTSTNPNVVPTIQVARKTSNGNTVIILSHFSASYPVIVARDLWLGYSSGNESYGTGWAILQTSSLAAYTNFDTVVARTSQPAGAVSGTTNYVAKFTSASTIGNSQIFDNGTNVGIGTTSPGAKLEIENGDIWLDAPGGGNPEIRFIDDGGISVAGAKIRYENNNGNLYIEHVWDQPTSGIFFRNRTAGTSLSTLTLMDGNVGIGITSPGNLLHLYKASDPYIRVQGGGNYSYIRLDDGSTNGYLIKNVSAGTANNALAGALYTYTDNNKAFQHIHSGAPLFTILSTGNTGVGTVGPSYRLDVSGTARATSDFRAPIFYDTDNTGYYLDAASTSNLNRVYINYNSASSLANSTFNVASSTIGGLHFTNGAGVSGAGNEAAITFMGSSASAAQAGIYVHNNNSEGTHMAFATTDSYATGPQIGLRIMNSGYSYFPRSYVEAGGSFRAPIFYDNANTSYYADLNSFSQMRTLRLLGDWSESGVHLETFTVRGTYASMCQRATNGNQGYALHHIATDGAWYMYGGRGSADGTSWDWSQRNYPNQDGNYVEFRTSARAPIFYDRDNTGYYLDPASTTNINVFVSNGAAYFYDWVRTYGQTGLYSQSYGQHFYPQSNGLYWTITSVSSTGGIQVRTAYESTVKGYVGYWDSNGYGLLSGGSWWLNDRNGDPASLIIGGYPGLNAYNSVTSRRLLFGGGDSDAYNNYYIGTNLENYGGNYNKLDLRWHTGIRMGAQPSYGGIRFYDTEDLGTQVFAIGKDGAYAQANQSMRAPIFYDLDNTGYYVDSHADRSTNINGFSARTVESTKGTYKYNIPRFVHTSDTNYWVGTMGWGQTDFNTVMTWGSGFFDTWSSPANSPGDTSHWVGVQAYHYVNAANSGYGWQLAGGPTDSLWWRHSWPSNSSWFKVAMYNNNASTSAFYSTINYDSNDTGYYVDPNGGSSIQNLTARRHFMQGVGGDSGVGTEAYCIFQEGGGWSFPYPDLRIAYHTGIKLGANPSYEGMRFYTDYDMSSRVMQVNGGSSYIYMDRWVGVYGHQGIYAADGTNGAHIYPNNGDYGSWRMDGTRNGWYGIYFASGSTLMMNDGDGGIHRSGNGWRIYHSGNDLYARGNITAYWSDRRLKQNIKPLEKGAGLELIDKLIPSSFEWNALAVKVNEGFYEGQEETALIAQEVQEILPIAVVENKAGRSAGAGSNEESYLTVKYDKITPFIIQAVKDLKQEIDDLKAEIERLKGQSNNGVN